MNSSSSLQRYPNSTYLSSQELQLFRNKYLHPSLLHPPSHDSSRKDQLKKIIDLNRAKALKERYSKFQKAELEKRKLDDEEESFRQQKRMQTLLSANRQVFRNTPQIRSLQRVIKQVQVNKVVQRQIEFKQQLKKHEQDVKRYHHQQVLESMAQQGRRQELKALEQSSLAEEEKAFLKKQIRQLKKQKYQHIQNQQLEGQLIRARCQQFQIESDQRKCEERCLQQERMSQVGQTQQVRRQMLQQERAREMQELQKIALYNRQIQLQKEIIKRRIAQINKDKRLNQELVLAQLASSSQPTPAQPFHQQLVFIQQAQLQQRKALQEKLRSSMDQQNALSRQMKSLKKKQEREQLEHLKSVFQEQHLRSVEAEREKQRERRGKLQANQSLVLGQIREKEGRRSQLLREQLEEHQQLLRLRDKERQESLDYIYKSSSFVTPKVLNRFLHKEFSQ